MKYLYLLESISNSSKRYIGITGNLNNRLKEHNTGKLPHTAKFKPWKIVVAVRFTDNHRAEAFERHLNSGSGRAFAKKRL